MRKVKQFTIAGSCFSGVTVVWKKYREGGREERKRERERGEGKKLGNKAVRA